MITIRKISLWFCSAAFQTLLVITALISTMVMVLGKPDNIKTVLKDNGVYSSVVDGVLEKAQAATAQSQGDQLPINDPAIKEAANKAFTPDFLQSSTEQFLDGTYAWLNGESAQPTFNIDISGPRQTFIQLLADASASKFQTLPTCTPQQLAAMGTEIDLFSATCRPTNVNVQQQKERLVQELTVNKDFLPDTKITPASLAKDEQGKTAFDNLSELPKVYNLVNFSPFLLGILTLLAGTGMVLLHDSKRRGLRKAALAVLASGAVLTIVSVLFVWVFDKALEPSGSIGKQLQGDTMLQTLGRVIDAFNQLISQRLLWFGVAYIVIGGGILLAIKFLWKEPGVKVKPSPTPTAKSNPSN